MSIILQPPFLPVWQRELAQGFRSPEELLAFLGLPPVLGSQAAQKTFPFLVPRGFAARMRPGDPNDPLLRQVLPRIEETFSIPGFVNDPVGDTQASRAPGVLHKYPGRVLLIATGACAIHCRYCFRREFPYLENQLNPTRQEQALAYIRKDPSIKEVILSGGDPLMLKDARLENLILALAEIPHLQRLRIHSRLPIVLPSRITDGLVQTLTATRLTCVMVVHANHANEINSEVTEAISKLRQRAILVLNQSTLLKGINDSIEALVALQETAFAAGILPYYLHLLDRARGTAHFEVPETEARMLYEHLRRRLPGYLVPRLAREQAKAQYKIWL
ncbi:MAG: EF-P beta-lysylation protein EpmB [Methylohalobius sp.]|nr:EF-P beta-lysylation protein EpmB [Methylohalobius sp.]